METVGKSQQQRCGLSKMIHGHMQIIILIIKELTFYRNYSVSLHCHEYMICDLIHIYKEYIIFRGKKNDTIAGQYCANHLICYLYYKIFQVGCCSLQCPVRSNGLINYITRSFLIRSKKVTMQAAADNLKDLVI